MFQRKCQKCLAFARRRRQRQRRRAAFVPPSSQAFEELISALTPHRDPMSVFFPWEKSSLMESPPFPAKRRQRRSYDTGQ